MRDRTILALACAIALGAFVVYGCGSSDSGPSNAESVKKMEAAPKANNPVPDIPPGADSPFAGTKGPKKGKGGG